MAADDALRYSLGSGAARPSIGSASAPRPSVGLADARETIGATATLLARNKEIAAIRDDVVKAESELGALQKTNKDLLQSSSELDSESQRQCALAAVFEQECAESEAQLRTRERQLQEQQTAHRSLLGPLHRVGATEAEDQRQSNEAVAVEEQRISRLNIETEQLRRDLQETETPHASLQWGHANLAAPASEAAAAVRASVESAVQAVALKQDALSEAAELREYQQHLEAELAAERRRRDELGSVLRRAVSEQASGPSRLQSLEGTIAAFGGDAGRVLRNASDPVTTAACAASVALRKGTELTSELRASEAQCAGLRATVARKREQASQQASSLQGSLDTSRADLQRHLVEVAATQRAEVTALEDELATAEDRIAANALQENEVSDEIQRLQHSRSEALQLKEFSIADAKERAVALAGALCQVRSEIDLAEQRAAASHATILETKRLTREAIADGERRCAKVRSMIDELWRGIQQATAGVPVGIAGRLPGR